MTTQSHSPLPWFQTNGASGTFIQATGNYQTAPTNIIVAELRPSPLDTDLANAQLIVSAVNSHSALVEALEKTLECTASLYRYSPSSTTAQVMADARAALALAKGGVK